MADIYGCHFEYNNISSRTLGLILANVTSERVTSISGTISGAFVYDRRIKGKYLINNDYSDSPMSYEIDLITDNQEALTKSQCRTAEKWLFNRHSFGKLYIDSDDDCDGYTSETIDGSVKRLYLICRFINASRIENSEGVIGYHATIETDSGYWWQDTVTKSFETNLATASSYKTVTFDTDTDIDDYLYPKITMVIGSVGGSVSLTNKTDSTTRITKIDNISPNSTVVINSGLNYISDNLYSSFDKRNFPRLLDGRNKVTVKGNVTSITFEFNNRRFL